MQGLGPVITRQVELTEHTVTRCVLTKTQEPLGDYSITAVAGKSKCKWHRSNSWAFQASRTAKQGAAAVTRPYRKTKINGTPRLLV